MTGLQTILEKNWVASNSLAIQRLLPKLGLKLSFITLFFQNYIGR